MTSLELLLRIYEKRGFDTWHPYCYNGGYHVQLNKLYMLGLLYLQPVKAHEGKGTAWFTPEGVEFIKKYNALLA